MIRRWWKAADAKWAGTPDDAITVLLLLAAVFLLWLALAGPRPLKAAVFLWVALP